MSNIKRYIAAAVVAAGFAGSAYYYPAETFIASTVGWLFIIPAAFVAYMGYGLVKYMQDRKNRIVVHTAPSAAMMSIARHEAQLQREKELMLYDEYSK
jgi:hypothetical protein